MHKVIYASCVLALITLIRLTLNTSIQFLSTLFLISKFFRISQNDDFSWIVRTKLLDSVCVSTSLDTRYSRYSLNTVAGGQMALGTCLGGPSHSKCHEKNGPVIIVCSLCLLRPPLWFTTSTLANCSPAV